MSNSHPDTPNMFERSAQGGAVFGLGLAALGRPGYINIGHSDDLADTSVAAMQAHAHTMLDAAWSAGVRYFDVARSYGRGEEFLGTWLRSRSFPDELPIVGSKWGYTYTADWQIDAEQHEVKEHTLSVLRRQWPQSQAHLSPYLRLYQIHSATFDSGVLQRRDVLDELARIKQSGVRIGLSLSGADQAEVLATAMAVRVDGAQLFDTVQATYNVLEPSCAPALSAAHAAGMAVIVKEALANGRLTDRGLAAHVRQTLQPIAERQGIGIDALALATVLAQPWVAIVLSGAATPEHLASNLAAREVTLTADELAELATLAEAPQDYWKTRSRLTWN